MHTWWTPLATVGAVIGVLCASCSDPRSAPEPASTNGNADAGGDARVDDADAGDAGAADADTFALPGLSAGSHLAVFEGYELPSTAAAGAVNARRAELLAAGADISRVHVSFRDLSPAPGVVDIAPLVDAIRAAPEAARHIIALIETIDSDGFADAMPTDLVDPQTPYALRDGLTLDAPAVTARFDAVLTAFAASNASQHLVALSVGNEPDAYFDDVDTSSTAGQAYMRSLSAFVSHARATLRAAGSTLPVAMTLRSALLEREPITLGALVAAGDVAIFNYYGQDEAFQVVSGTRVAGALDTMLSLARDKPVILQEVGCPAGKTGGALSSSDSAQAAFFSALIAGMATRPQIRVAVVFQLVDWSPALSATYGTAYTQAGFPALGAQVEESLSTVGLLRYADGSARPAFDVIKAGVRMR